MMTDEIYQVLEDCGAAEMPINETCEIAEISEQDFYSDHQAIKRYRKGQLQTKLKIRQAVIRMAREGVPQMTKIYKEFANASLPDLTAANDVQLDIDDTIDDIPDADAEESSK